jgi:hypothetical protein
VVVEEVHTLEALAVLVALAVAVLVEHMVGQQQLVELLIQVAVVVVPD